MHGICGHIVSDHTVGRKITKAASAVYARGKPKSLGSNARGKRRGIVEGHREEGQNSSATRARFGRGRRTIRKGQESSE